MNLRVARFGALLTALATSLLTTLPARAIDPAEAPVAVRWWGQAFFTIETWWGLTVASDPYSTERTGYEDPGVSADLVLITTEHVDVDYQMVADNTEVVLDTRGAMRRVAGKARVISLSGAVSDPGERSRRPHGWATMAAS